MFDFSVMTTPELHRLIKNLEAELEFRKETRRHQGNAGQGNPGKGNNNGKGRNK